MEMEQRTEVKEFNRLYKELDDLYHEIALGMGLSDSAFVILYTLCELGDGCLQKDICGVSFLSKQTINSSIRKLEREGLVRLRAGRGRELHIHLTETGRGLVREKILPVADMENRVFSAMTPEESRELLSLTKRYVDLFREKSKGLR